jgi:two-component system repressor protein LuxO
MNDGEVLTAAMLPPLTGTLAPVAEPLAPRVAAAGVSPSDIRPLWQVEKDTIMAAIDACGGNVPRAAAFLEIGVSTIYRKKAEWEAAAAKRADVQQG